MYHFTFIDEASHENEQDLLQVQETAQHEQIENSQERNTLFQKTTEFLHRYLDQKNCVRIFISKN